MKSLLVLIVLVSVTMNARAASDTLKLSAAQIESINNVKNNEAELAESLCDPELGEDYELVVGKDGKITCESMDAAIDSTDTVVE